MGLDIVIQILKGTDGTQFAHRNLDFIRLLNQSDQIDQAQAVKLERIADVGIRSKTAGSTSNSSASRLFTFSTISSRVISVIMVND